MKRLTMQFACCLTILLLAKLGQAGVTIDFVTNTDMNSAEPDTTEFALNDAIFQWGTDGGGTGNLQSIVRMSHSGSSGPQQGYNTSGRPVPFDENSSGTFTRNAQIGAVPIVMEGGVSYYEFLFDMNQSNGSGSMLSIDQIQIYTSSTGSQTTTAVGILGTLRYDLDAGMDNEIVLDHAISPGSGTTDMRMLIPTMNFTGANPTDFVYLFSSMGNKDANHVGTGGFEEWAFRGNSVAVPEPSSFLFLGFLAVICASRRSVLGMINE